MKSETYSRRHRKIEDTSITCNIDSQIGVEYFIGGYIMQEQFAVSPSSSNRRIWQFCHFYRYICHRFVNIFAG